MKDYLDDNAVEYQSLVDDCLRFDQPRQLAPGGDCLSPRQELPLGDLSDGALSSQQHRAYAPKGQIYEIAEASHEQSNSCLSSRSNNPKLSDYASAIKGKSFSIAIRSSKSNASQHQSTHSNDTVMQDFEEGEEVHSALQGTNHEDDFDASLITPKVSRIINPNKVDSILNNVLLLSSGANQRSSLPAEPLGRRSQLYTAGFE